MRKHCGKCHGDQTRKAELSLLTGTAMLQGGESGPLFVPAKPAESLLWEMVESKAMPPEEEPPLSAPEMLLIKRWIEQGAPFESGQPAARSLSQHDVVPLLHRRCTVCHGYQYRDGELDLRTRDSLLLGGKSGPAMVPGRPGESLLVLRVREDQCPPRAEVGEAGIEPMTKSELAVLEAWVAAGAPVVSPGSSTESKDPQVSAQERKFWSFQTPVRPGLPMVDGMPAGDAVDQFLLAALRKRDLTFSPSADRQTWLRRVTFDLTGLPPSQEEVRDFLNDQRPGAIERAVERLLASPRYGERWARFWLDLAGYADSEGKRNADTVRPYAYRYRDYVIRSLNEAKPYDQFLREQLAGDELVDYSEPLSAEELDTLIATGFLRMAPDGTAADPVNQISDRIEVIADELDVLGRGVLGLTFQCARCHSHKYDPIPQRDYYRLVAIFRGAYDEYDWLTPQPFNNQWKRASRRFLEVSTDEERRQVAARNAPILKKIADLEAGEVEDKKELQKQVAALRSELQEVPKVRALWDRGQPSPVYIYRRGDENQPTRLVEPGIPSVLDSEQNPYRIEPPQHGSSKTGRRLAFARWVTHKQHPLTARVIVNRVWQRHFGQGIVRSLDNFGAQGTRPSHPELLDWLAVEFVEHGWDLKWLHRVLCTSQAYRQSSELTEERLAKDPDNVWLSRMPMRRLDAEQLRDALVHSSGLLMERPFGPPDPVTIRKDGLVVAASQSGAWRRSVFLRQRRKEMPSILETFDLPQMNPNCTERAASTVVSQPLYLLNNKLIVELATALAGRIEQEIGTGDLSYRHVERVFLHVLGRYPSDEELTIGLEAVQELSRLQTERKTDAAAGRVLADFCHMMFNSAAFLFID